MSDIIYVSTTEELYDALATCTGGETILLEPGYYGDLILNVKTDFDFAYPETVTIASADPDDPAVFSTMGIDGAENLTIDGVYFDYTFSENDASSYKPFQVINSSNVTIVNCTFDGDVAEGISEVDDGYGWAYGLYIDDCTEIIVENNEVFGFMRGMLISDTTNLDVIANDVHSMRMDGMNFANVDNVLIEDNYIHDFAGSPDSGDHCDMIQFWTGGTDSPSTNVTINNNVLDIGDGTPAQAIFMRNEEVDTGAAGEEMYYQDIVITNNVITNASSHGITVGETDGLIISNNSVLHSDGGNPDGLDSSVEIPNINVNENSTNVTITQNATNTITGWNGQSDWVVADNAFVQDQDPDAAGYYGDVFVSTSLQLVDGLHSYQALEGGMLDTLQAGAPDTISPPSDQPLDAQFQVSASNDNAAVRSFDAAVSSTFGEPLPEGATYTWDFGDGTTASGPKVSHTYSDGGIYEVNLTITLPDGTTDIQSLAIGVQAPTLVSMSPDGEFVAYEHGEAYSIISPDSDAAEGIQLGALGNTLALDQQHFSDIYGADDVRIDLTLRADALTSAGELFQLPGSFILSVSSTGELHARIWTEADGEVVIATSGAGLTDMNAHDISIHVTDTDIEIFVDGAVLGSAEVSSGMAYTGTHELFIGNPWDKENFSGDLLAFEISANADDFEAETVLPEEPAVETPSIEEPVAEEPIMEEPVAEEPVVAEPVTEDPVIEEPVEEEPTHGNGNGNASMMARIFEFLKSLLGLQSTIRAEVDDADADTSEADKLALEEDEQASDPDSLAA